MKKLKLFFALFAMLALNVGNAWGADVSVTWPKTTALSTTATNVDGDANVTIKVSEANTYTNPLRFYAGKTTTIEVAEGYQLKSVAYEASSTGNYVTYARDATVSPDVTPSVNDKIITWDLSGSNTKIFTFKPSSQTRCNGITITYTAASGETPGEGGGEEPTPDPEEPTPGTGSSTGWVETAIGNITSSDIVVVTMTNSSGTYAMSNDKGTGAAPTAVKVTVNGDKLSEEPADNLKWNITNSSGSLTIYPNGSTSTWLYCTNTNNGTRVGTNTSKTFIIDGTYLKHSGTSRYVGVYNSQDWRCYTSSSTNISGQTLKFYKYVEQSSEGGGSEETAPSLTEEQFSWSAATATATLPNTFDNKPTLTNTENLEVTYSSSNGEVATIDENGNVTLEGVGTADIKATAGGEGTTFKETTVFYTLTVNKAPATPTDNVYVKVTSTEGITNGEYLIVYETGKVAFNGALTALDAVSNTIEVEITDGTIAGTNYIDDATFTIDATANTIKSASGYYIGKTASGNGLNTDKTTAYTNTITIDAEKNAVVVSSGGPTLRYNKASDQARFRYYGSGQQAIALYKKASKHIVTIADCTNGSVSAKIGETALVTNDQVLSGIQITLSNEATTGYKLSAYDVYKTDDATTKVTVADDNTFIMPEFDVTISATFVPAKTLTSIEITTAATQTTFWQGETFNYTGLEVTAHFDGAADEVVTPTVTGSTATAGTQTVTVSFTEGSVTKTTTYNITVNAIPNTKETAYTVADAFDIIDKLTTADGVFIKGIVSQVDEYFPTYKSITYWISVDGTTTNQLQVYSGKGLEGADFVDINGVSVEDQVIVCGNLKKYSGTYEFDKNTYLAEHTKTTKADPELSYTPTEYNVNLGEAFTAPTLNNTHNLTVTYSSNNEDVATVAADGAVTIKAAGTVVITASFAGNDDYIAGSASYTINITDPNLLEVTFDATQDLDANNTERGEGKIIKAPITFACTDGILGSSTYGHYRIYANAKATFSAAEGYIITKVVLTSTASNDSQYGPGLLSTEEGYTYSGKGGTWVGEAYTVTLSASAQVRATTITVYYKQDNRVDAGLAWNPATVSLTVGDAFTAPTFINPKNVTGIEFTSSNDALATVSNTGVISLVSGKTGTATITATFAGDATYKPAEVTCIISVNPKTEDVVIVAQQGGKWYALKAEDLDGANKTMAALEVEYINGVVYNLSDAEKTAITWERAVIGNQVTFKHGDKYLFGTTGGTDLKLSVDECEWTYNGKSYMIGARTFLYREGANGFKNYNAGTNAGTADYSALPVVTAAKFENATIITRSDLSAGNFGTICYENNITNFTGATFYEVAGKEGRKVIFDEVTELVAGMPYIFRAEAAELKIVLGQENTTTAGQHKSLQGTFEKIEDGEAGEAGNTLEGNYIIYNNFIKKCGAKCGLLGNRAYFIADALNNLTAPVSPAPGRKRVSMDVLGENEATGVDNITENGVIAPAMLGTYDVLGRQLSEPTATGFYIVNGKKVFVVK